MTNFSIEERNLVFEMLGIVPGGSFFWVDYNAWFGGDLTSVPFSENIDFTLVKTELDSRLDTIQAADGTDNRRIRISEIIAEYDLIALDTISIGDGGGGGARGSRYSSKGQRRHLRNLLQIQIGMEIRVFGTVGRTTVRDSGQALGGGGIPIVR